MTGRLKRLTSLDDLEAAVAGSGARPVLLFTHSLTCGASAWALDELRTVLDGSEAPVDAFVVEVQTSRPLCAAIAERFGIRHASPQLLLVRQGRVAWRASHFGLGHRAIADAVARELAVTSDGTLASSSG